MGCENFGDTIARTFKAGVELFIFA